MVLFDEAAHTYTNSETGKRYISATQLIALFKQDFNTKEVSERHAKKHGHTPAYWAALWAEKNDAGNRRGNAFHKAKEDLINGSGVVVFKNQIHFARNQEFFDPSDLAPGVYTELRLSNEAYGIAGTSDIVIVRASKVVTSIHQAEKIVDLDDHKTNEQIHVESYYFERSKQHKMMKYPLDHLMDCNLVHYNLQLSIYAYMLEMMGYTVGDLQITHYGHPNPITKKEPEPVVYPLGYMKKEVLMMFNYYRINKQAA
jgi:hypothetical protein